MIWVFREILRQRGAEQVLVLDASLAKYQIFRRGSGPSRRRDSFGKRVIQRSFVSCRDRRICDFTILRNIRRDLCDSASNAYLVQVVHGVALATFPLPNRAILLARRLAVAVKTNKISTQRGSHAVFTSNFGGWMQRSLHMQSIHNFCFCR